MPRMSMTLTGHEAGILWKFFDGVSAAVSGRMLHGSSPGEENLTFLLCELLDANTTSLHVLPYPLSQAQEDLASSDSGITVEVEFQTHEHPKHIESRYSGADLGLVVEIDHPFFGRSRRGFLIQAKRLFPTGKMREFSLYSDYRSFDREQAQFLKLLQEPFGAYSSVFYLWYNPPATAFPEPEAKILKAYEAHSSSFSPYWGRFHPFIDELIESGFPWSFGGDVRLSGSTKEDDRVREWRATQPALRVSALDAVLSLVADAGPPPRLKALYESVLERRSSSPCFSPFADFFLLALGSSRWGSANADWLSLTEGHKIRMPPGKPERQNADESPLAEMESPPTPRHTLKVTVRSTLPNLE